MYELHVDDYKIKYKIHYVYVHVQCTCAYLQEYHALCQGPDHVSHGSALESWELNFEQFRKLWKCDAALDHLILGNAHYTMLLYGELIHLLWTMDLIEKMKSHHNQELWNTDTYRYINTSVCNSWSVTIQYWHFLNADASALKPPIAQAAKLSAENTVTVPRKKSDWLSNINSTPGFYTNKLYIQCIP